MKRMKHAEQRLDSHDSKNEKEGLVAEEEEEEKEEQEGTGGHWPHCDYFHNIASNTIAIIKVDGFCVTQSCFVVIVTKNNNKITFHTNGF